MAALVRGVRPRFQTLQAVMCVVVCGSLGVASGCKNPFVNDSRPADNPGFQVVGPKPPVGSTGPVTGYAFGRGVMTPEEVCTKMMAFETDQDAAAAMVPYCKTLLENARAKSVSGYECLARCVENAPSRSVALACDKSCPDFDRAVNAVNP